MTGLFLDEGIYPIQRTSPMIATPLLYRKVNNCVKTSVDYSTGVSFSPTIVHHMENGGVYRARNSRTDQILYNICIFLMTKVIRGSNVELLSASLV